MEGVETGGGGKEIPTTNKEPLRAAKSPSRGGGQLLEDGHDVPAKGWAVGALDACKHECTSVYKVCARAPLTWIVPLAMFLVLVTVSQVAIGFAADTYVNQEKTTAKNIIANKVSGINSALLTMQGPMMVVSTAIMLTPNVPELNANFISVMNNAKALDPEDAIYSLKLLPFGQISAMWPVNAPQLRTLNFNAIKAETFHAYAISLIKRDMDEVNIAGPLKLLAESGTGFGISMVQFVAGNGNETWGLDKPSPLPYAPGDVCTVDGLPGPCIVGSVANPALDPALCGDVCAPRVIDGKTYAFWGTVTITVSAEAIMQLLSELEIRFGYAYCLTRQTDLGTEAKGAAGGNTANIGSTVIFPLGGVCPSNAQSDMECASVYGSGHVPFEWEVCAVPANGRGTSWKVPERLVLEWELCVVPDGGWGPSWKVPLQIGTVFASLLIAILIFLVFLNSERRRVAVVGLQASTAELTNEKARLNALLVRQLDLLNCFGNASVSTSVDDDVKSALGKIHTMRAALKRSEAALAESEKIEILELIGSGSFGKVYKGLWHGTIVAVKCMTMPSAMSRSKHAERMTIVEAAISSAMSHPHLVQTYTYSIKPLKGSSDGNDDVDDSAQGLVAGGADAKAPRTPACRTSVDSAKIASVRPATVAAGVATGSRGAGQSTATAPKSDTIAGHIIVDKGSSGSLQPPTSAMTQPPNSATSRISSIPTTPANTSRLPQHLLTQGSQSHQHGYEVQLVLEYCDLGSLRENLDAGIFCDDEGLNYTAVLETAADVAKGMVHLHTHGVLHSDLKASNVMLRSGGSDGRGCVAKVVDFGLAITLDADSDQTHVSSMFHGTLTHMAPEVLMEGKQSKAADVYAFGITLWELYTGAKPFKGVPRVVLAHTIVFEGKRPKFPEGTASDYRMLSERCWHPQAEERPTFSEVLRSLQELRGGECGRARLLMAGCASLLTTGEQRASGGPEATNAQLSTAMFLVPGDDATDHGSELLADTSASWIGATSRGAPPAPLSHVGCDVAGEEPVVRLVQALVEAPPAEPMQHATSALRPCASIREGEA
ncbi:hypothetical protein FOA52_006811 [Chlamydomonas sp. UWO 241]|nr:hypothetical protein FOA52_006811 [Chlamydomonas sp. UWO 241]